MTYVRMLIHRTGSRYDGQEWPPYKGLIDVPDWEAGELVRDHIAQYTETPELDRGWDVLKTADPDYESRLNLADGQEAEKDELPASFTAPVEVSSLDFDDDFESLDDDIDVTPQVKRPSTVDNKATWIEYAVSKGANRERAAAKTKAMLIADY